ncbi:MAG: YqhA family protein [Pseudomonadota bacterium]
MKSLESIFEGVLWESRFAVLFAVIASLFSSFSVFYMATVDAYYMMSHLGEYASPALDVATRNSLRGATITHVVEIIDGYLLATVLLIFSLGLYELFISKIDKAEQSEASSNVLLITSLDDLKARLAKVILMILIVKFFEHAINMVFKTPLDLLYLAAGISLLGLALYLSHAAEQKPETKKVA